MKKLLICLLLLLALPVGLFFWKGGHYALELAPKLAAALDSPTALQHLECTLNGDDTRLTADITWQPHGSGRIYGLADQGVYVHGNVLILDNGRSYSLPRLQADNDMRRAVFGILAYGRIVKDGDEYLLTAQAEGLELKLSITAGKTVTAASGSFRYKNTAIQGSVTSLPTEPRDIPAAVEDAIVLATMEPPPDLEDALKALVPALEQLKDLEADVSLGVACGVLNLEETVQVAVQNGTALITREGMELEIDLPGILETVEPIPAAVAILRAGEFSQEGDIASFRLALPEGTAGDLCTEAVPQLAELGVRFSDAAAELAISEGRLQTITLTANGKVPFLITEIPITFQAVFSVKP